MNQIVTYVAIGGGLLLIALLIPGLKLIAEAILKVTLEFTYSVFRHKGSFIVWFFKTIVSDHMRVLRHATRSRDEIDPTNKVRRKAKGYED